MTDEKTPASALGGAVSWVFLWILLAALASIPLVCAKAIFIKRSRPPVPLLSELPFRKMQFIELQIPTTRPNRRENLYGFGPSSLTLFVQEKGQPINHFQSPRAMQDRLHDLEAGDHVEVWLNRSGRNILQIKSDGQLLYGISELWNAWYPAKNSPYYVACAIVGVLTLPFTLLFLVFNARIFFNAAVMIRGVALKSDET